MQQLREELTDTSDKKATTVTRTGHTGSVFTPDLCGDPTWDWIMTCPSLSADSASSGSSAWRQGISSWSEPEDKWHPGNKRSLLFAVQGQHALWLSSLSEFIFFCYSSLTECCNAYLKRESTNMFVLKHILKSRHPIPLHNELCWDHIWCIRLNLFSCVK